MSCLSIYSANLIEYESVYLEMTSILFLNLTMTDTQEILISTGICQLCDKKMK
jgi:hypothetical protein